MRLTFSRSRLKWKNYNVPLNFVVFEHDNQLGYFNEKLYQVGLNKRLLLINDPKLIDDVLRHELAHLITFLIYGRSVDDHGKEYREVCKSFNWSEEVYSAKIVLEKKLPQFENVVDQNIKLKEKINKLFNLAQSENENESQAATAMANKLLLKFNLSHKDLEHAFEEETFLLKIMSGPRVNSKVKAIYEILTTFNVQPVFNHAKGYFYLEVIGTRASVELADYICSYLDKELERLWLLTKSKNPSLKGQTAKNSYFRGLASGYKESIVKTQAESFTKKELISLQKDLETKVKQVYGKLSYSSSSRVKENGLSKALGKKDGKNLKIKKALSNINPIKLLR